MSKSSKSKKSREEIQAKRLAQREHREQTPDDTHATTELVARYYEVPVETIKSVVKDNREELESNRYRVLAGSDLATFARSFRDLANLGLSPKARSLAIFSRRAVLNVGMLLRDSQVARFLNTKIRPEGHRFLSTTEVQKALDELVKAEEIVVVQPAERYRENHGWAERPAVYGGRDQ